MNNICYSKSRDKKLVPVVELTIKKGNKQDKKTSKN